MVKRLLNVKELSNYLAMPVASVYTYVHTQKIPKEAIVKMGRALRFEKEEIDRWINAQKILAASDSLPSPETLPGPSQ